LDSKKHPVADAAPFLGAQPEGDGVSFAVYAREAYAVDLCLFDPARPIRETGRFRLRRDENDV
jgi:pullulanase/glycogen debranching enzyme